MTNQSSDMVTNIHFRMFQLQLDFFQEYVKHMESFLADRIEKLEAEVEKIYDDGHSPDLAGPAGWYGDELYKYEQVFPGMMRESLLVSIYALFDGFLARLSGHMHRSRRYLVSPHDLADSGIRRSKLYLKKVVGIPFPENSSEWQTICNVATVRGRLVHNQGFLHDEDLKILKNLAKFSDFEVDAHKHVVLGRNCLPDLIGVVGSFAKQLLAAVNSKGE